MKVALISPNFPPDHCGVGDYTARLAAELASQGHEPTVWTAQESPRVPGGVRVFAVPRPWTLGVLQSMIGKIKAEGVDAVVIQFTPYLFAAESRGFRPSLIPWIIQARRALGKDRPVILMAHELHYPTGVTPDRLALGVPQFAQFVALLLAASSTIFSYQVPYRRYSTCFPWLKKRLAWMGVGANIEPDRGSGAETSEKPVLLQFGSAHASRLYDYSFATLQALLATGRPYQLHFVGMTQEQVEKALRDTGFTELRESVRGLGYLGSSEVRSEMKGAELVLAPFVDGVSARRTSVMSALAHGRAVASTTGVHTDPGIPWDRFCSLTPVGDRDGFVQKTLTLLASPENRRSLAEEGRRAYEAYFSWAVLARNFITFLEEQRHE